MCNCEDDYTCIECKVEQNLIKNEDGFTAKDREQLDESFCRVYDNDGYFRGWV